MATNSLQSLNYHHHSPLKRHHYTTVDCPPATLFLKPTTTSSSCSLTNTTNSSPTITFALSSSSTSTSTTTTPVTSQEPTTSSFALLQHHLSSQDFRQADEETRRLLIVLAGESAQKRGYVFFSEVQFISPTDLKTIDDLWRQHSNNKFGYSTQKKIWNKVNKDFTRFFIKVGWMKKLDGTEVVQYNYRAFPNEFIWELTEDTPEGHLPLTNALRGTQLLNCILSHAAFDAIEDEEQVADEEREITTSNNLKGGGFSKALSNNRQFKSDYSF